MRGLIDGSHSVALGLQPDSRCTHYLILSKALLKNLSKSVDDEIHVEFDLVDQRCQHSSPSRSELGTRTYKGQKEMEKSNSGDETILDHVRGTSKALRNA